MTESLSVTSGDATASHGLDLGVEEELHVVDLVTRELVPRAQEILDRLDPAHFSAELHRSVVETNTPVAVTLDGLRDAIVDRRHTAITVAESLGLGLVASGTVPLVDLESLPVTPTSRYRRMLDDYQMLAREQLICGAQVHVGVPDRDEAVAVTQRVASALPTLLSLSTSSPYWMGEDSGYASVRSLVWLRWPTAGDPGLLTSAAEFDELVADLIASGTITDPKMVYFDVRPSAHVPTVELRVTDSSPDVDTVVLIAGLFRGLVLRAQQDYRADRPFTPTRPPLHRGDVARRPLGPGGRPAALAAAGTGRGCRRAARRRPAPSWRGSAERGRAEVRRRGRGTA